MRIYKKQLAFMLFLMIAIATWVGVIFLRQDKNPAVDERTHLRQIHRFADGNYKILDNLTNIPGYHLAIATILYPIEDPTDTEIHFISLALSLLSVWIFYLLTRKLYPTDPYLRTLQFVFFPIVFFYFPLIYVDIFSLFLLLASFYLAICRRYTLSALFSLFSVAVRQNNIVWVAFILVYSYVEKNGFTFSFPKIKSHLRHSVGYLVVFISFTVFVLLNNGIALGDRENQQVGFYMGNIYFLLFLISILFLPILLSSLHKTCRQIIKRPIPWLLISGVILAALFLCFPPAIHSSNLKMYFLRNNILDIAYHRHNMIYAIMILVGCFSLFLMDIQKKHWLLLFPAAIAFLVPSLLIDQRYCIVPLTFLLLFRKSLGFKTELILLSYFMILSASLLYMFLRMGLYF